MPAKKSGPGIAWLAFDHEGRCFNVFRLRARSAAEAKAELIDRGYADDLTVRRQTQADTMGGYRPCACRDCMEIAIGGPGSYCHACAKAGCDDYQGMRRMSQECQAPSAYGGDDDDGPEPRGPRPTGRPRTMRINTKRFAACVTTFIAAVEQFLRAHGAQPTTSPYDKHRWLITTQAGPLECQPYEGGVFSRFQDVAKAKRHFGVDSLYNMCNLNIYSGKWNHHYGPEDICDGRAASDFIWHLKNIL